MRGKNNFINTITLKSKAEYYANNKKINPKSKLVQSRFGILHHVIFFIYANKYSALGSNVSGSISTKKFFTPPFWLL